MRLFTCVVVVGSLSVLAQFAASQPAQTHAKPTRLFANGTWEVVRQIGLHDDLLDDPQMIAINDTRAVVFDYGTNTVKSIRLDGTVEWKSGRAGKGPGEYINPTSLRLDASGRAIILDPELARITVLDPQGKVVTAIPLPRRFDAALPGPTSAQFILASSGMGQLTTLVDTLAALRPAMEMPADLHESVAITRELIGSLTSTTGHLLAFRWSSRMILVDRSGRFVRSCMGVDSLSIPPSLRSTRKIDGMLVEITKVDRSAAHAVQAVTSVGGQTVVLRSAAAGDTAMLADFYAPDCGPYRETRRLPVRATSVAGNADVLVAVVMEPAPHLVVLRWRPGS